MSSELAVSGRVCSGLAGLAVVPSFVDKSSFCVGWKGWVDECCSEQGWKARQALGCCRPQTGRCALRTGAGLGDGVRVR